MKPGSLFDRIFGFLGQLIALNLLWIVCSLPIITAGASTTALFYCTLKLHKDGDIRVLHDFFKSFKQNFRQSTLIWILMAAAGIFIYMEKEALATMPGSMSQIFNYVIFAFMNRRFDFKTPECEDDDTETKLYTKADVNVRKEAGKIAG